MMLIISKHLRISNHKFLPGCICTFAGTCGISYYSFIDIVIYVFQVRFNIQAIPSDNPQQSRIFYIFLCLPVAFYNWAKRCTFRISDNTGINIFLITISKYIRNSLIALWCKLSRFSITTKMLYIFSITHLLETNNYQVVRLCYTHCFSIFSKLSFTSSFSLGI